MAIERPGLIHLDFNTTTTVVSSYDSSNTPSKETQIYIERLSQLEETLWEERDRNTSTPEQLRNPIRRGLVGVVIPSKVEDQTERDAKMMDDISETLISLKDLSNYTVFIDWFNERIRGPHPEQTVYFLETLLHTACMLDMESYAQLMKTDSGKVSLLALDALGTCVDTVSSSHIIEENSSVIAASYLFNAQYQTAFKHFPIETVEVDQNEFVECKPNATELGSVLLWWIDQQKDKSSYSLEKGFRAILNYLKIYEAQEVEAFFDSLGFRYGDDNHALQQIRRRAIEYHHITATKEEALEVENQGLQEVLEMNITDAVDIDHKQQISPMTTKLIIRYETGSYGPCHEGHVYTAELTEELGDELAQSNPDFYSYYCIVPINSPKTLSKTGYIKRPERVGALAPRVGLIVTCIRHLKRAYVSTQLQQEFPNDPMRRVMTIERNIQQQLMDSYGVHRLKDLPFDDLILQRVFGAEKLIDRTDGNYSIRVPEPAFAHVNSLVIGRRGYLAGYMGNLAQIRELYPKATIVLSSWIPRDSSTLAIESGNFRPVSGVGLRMYDGYWFSDQSQQRTIQGLQDEEILSVTEYGKQVKELAKKTLNATNSV